MSPGVCLDTFGEEKISCSCWDSNLISSIPQRRHYSNYGIPACISDLDLLTVLHTLITVSRTVTVLALGSAVEQFCCRADEREPLLGAAELTGSRNNLTFSGGETRQLLASHSPELCWY